MPEKYQWFDLELLYPENWSVEEESDSQTLSVYSPSGAFFSVTRTSDIHAAFERVRLTMEQEYSEVETESSSRLLGEALLDGVSQRFVYLDFVVTSYLYKLETESPDFSPLLVQIQGEDRDLDQQLPVIDAMLFSLLQKIAI